MRPIGTIHVGYTRVWLPSIMNAITCVPQSDMVCKDDTWPQFLALELTAVHAENGTSVPTIGNETFRM